MCNAEDHVYTRQNNVVAMRLELHDTAAVKLTEALAAQVALALQAKRSSHCIRAKPGSRTISAKLCPFVMLQTSQLTCSHTQTLHSGYTSESSRTSGY